VSSCPFVLAMVSSYIYIYIMSMHIYDSWVTIIHGDIYRNVVVNHIVRNYYNLVN
jgi:hypothetical protein